MPNDCNSLLATRLNMSRRKQSKPQQMQENSPQSICGDVERQFSEDDRKNTDGRDQQTDRTAGNTINLSPLACSGGVAHAPSLLSLASGASQSTSSTVDVTTMEVSSEQVEAHEMSKLEDKVLINGGESQYDSDERSSNLETDMKEEASPSGAFPTPRDIISMPSFLQANPDSDVAVFPAAVAPPMDPVHQPSMPLDRAADIHYENSVNDEYLDESDQPLCIEEENGALEEEEQADFQHDEQQHSHEQEAERNEADDFPSGRFEPRPDMNRQMGRSFQESDERSDDKMDSGFSDRPIKTEQGQDTNENKSSELQLIREQVKMIQQQHAYQIQMIHYLQWQLTALTQQRQQSGESPPGGDLQRPLTGLSFNPLSQLIAKSASPTDPSHMSSMAALAMSSRRIGGISPVVQHEMLEAGQSPTSPAPRINGSYEKRHATSAEKQAAHFGDAKNDEQESNVFMHALKQRHLHQQAQPNQPFMFSHGGASLPEQMSAMIRAQMQSIPTDDTDGSRRPNLKEAMNRSPPVLPRSGQNGLSNSGKQDRTGATGNNDDEVLVKNQCRTCRRILSCPSALKLHYRTHTGERPYQCDLCSRAFTTRGNLRTHYSSVHRRELPPASASNSSGSGRRHNSAKPGSPLNCPLCKNSFDNQMSLAQHMQMHALANKQQQLMSLKQIMPQTANQFPFDAPTLLSSRSPTSENAVDLSSIAEHNNPDQHGSTTLPTIKQEPERSSPPPKQAEEHRRNDENKLPCGPFIKPSDALDLSTVSPNQKSSAPREDGSHNVTSPTLQTYDRIYPPSIQNIVSLNRIEESTEALESRRPPYFPCGICLRHFANERDLKEHLVTHESQCESPSSNDSMATADEQRHFLKRPFNIDDHSEGPDAKRTFPRHWCGICKKQFSSASSLQIHTRTHTGEKPFECNVCGRAFTTKGNLKVHMGTHVWGAGGSRRGRRVSMDNPVMSSWMKNSTNVGDVSAARNRNPELPNPVAGSPRETAASAAAASIYQQYAALAQGLMSRNQQGEPAVGFHSNPMMNLNPAAIAASRYLQQQQQQQSLTMNGSSRSTEGSPEGRTEASLSSDGEQEQGDAPSTTSAAAAANEWLWKAYQRTQGQVN